MTGKFSAHINWCEKFLGHLDLLEEKNISSKKITSPLSLFRNMQYEEIWKYCISNNIYNFLLKDSSIIQINYFDQNDFSFSYYSSPYEALSYKEFLLESDIEFNEIGYGFYSEYEVYLSQAPKSDHPVMIRYDYAPKDYTEGIHPASHLHVGFKNVIRIGLKCIMSPQSFFLLLLRLCYPSKWFTLLNLEQLHAHYESVLKSHIEDLDLIESKFLKKKDSYEFYIS